MGFAICTFYDQFHESVSRFSQNFHLRPNQTVYLDLRLKGKQNEIYFFILNSSSRTNNFLSCSLVCSFGIFCVFFTFFYGRPFLAWLEFSAVLFWDLVPSSSFAFLTAVVLFNALQFYQKASKNGTYRYYSESLGYLNMSFTVIFSIESVLKILAFGPKVCMSHVHFCFLAFGFSFCHHNRR